MMNMSIACPMPLARAMLLPLVLLCFAMPSAWAEDTVCARVKIEIRQELTLERQGFDAEMKINNTTDTGVIQNVSVVVKVTEEDGTPVVVTDNPNDLSAKFFLRLSSKQNIDAVDGTGSVAPQTRSTIDWLLIPAPGSAGANPLGKKYRVGATLKYTFGGEQTVLDVSPDVITVKPLPLLTLDYFLTQDVWGDDPLTSAIEPVEPFTLGVRVKNTGYAAAKNLKIDSAQPKIVENNQGLLINFTLIGSFVNDAPMQDTLLIDFGDLAAGSNKMGRWIMETTLAGKFTEFTAKFSHADELGGSLTSILQATNPHFLIRDVRVDLPGRDSVRDFLARDGDVIRVYESDSTDSEVTDRSGNAVFAAGANAGGTVSYRLSFPPTAGFVYVKRPDPFNGQKVLGPMVRSDAKAMGAENVWLSKTRNAQSKQVEYWVNVFDVNSTGLYDIRFDAPPAASHAPVIQFIPNRTTQEQQQVSFLVEASSPDGKPVTLSATPLPAGAKLSPQAADPASPGVSRAVFDWTPARSTAGDYLIVYTASDGTLSAASSATITVQASAVGLAAPAAGNDSAVTRKNVNVTLAVFANDSLAANSTGFDPATLDLDTSTTAIDAARTVPGEGTFTANPSGTVTFDPLPSFTGLCTITYRVKDKLGQATNTANLTVTVTGPGNPAGDIATVRPVANPDQGTTLLNTPIMLAIKLNDVAGPGQTLNLSSVDFDIGTDGVQSSLTTTAGTWKSNGDGTVTFTPAAGYAGPPTLAYAIADSADQTAQSTLSIAVTGGGVPLAQNDSGSTLPSTPITLAILDNDTPSAGQVLVPGKVDLDPATPDQLDGTITTAEGNWTANANGMLTFAPTGSYKTTHQPFTGSTPPLPYTVTDSSGQIAAASIGIAVNSTAAPTAASASASTAFNTPMNVDPAGKGTASPGSTLNPTTLDLNPDTSSVEQSLTTTDGTWTVNADGTVSFAPAFNFTGTTAAQPYLIRDSLGHSANAYLNVTVALPASVLVSGTVFQDVNLDQVQDGGERGINAGGALYVTAVNAGFPVATSAVAADGSYTLALTPDASYTLVLSANPLGSTTPSLPVGWGNTGSNNNGLPVGAIDGTLNIRLGVATLSGQNFGITQGPHAVNDSFGTAYGILLNGTVASNDTYPNGSVFSMTVGSGHGTALVNPDGSYRYAPASGFSGTDSFGYQVCLPSPNGNLCDTATVTITVAARVIPPDLRIEKAASASQPAVGQPFTYTLTVGNSGGPTTGPVQVSDALPSGIKLVAVQAGTGWVCTPAVSSTQPLQGGNGATLTCNLTDPLPVGSQTITLTAVATAVTGSYINQATVTGDGKSPDLLICNGTAAVNCGQATITPKNPRLELVQKVALNQHNSLEDLNGDGQAQVGDKLTYAFTLANRGDVPLSPVTLNDAQLDAGSLICTGTTAQHKPFSLGGSDNTLDSNDSVVCTGKHTVNLLEGSAGRVRNGATATGKAPDGSPWQSASNGDWYNTPPAGQFSLSKTALHHDMDGDGLFDQGETLTHNFIIRNVGSVALSGITVSDPLLPLIACPPNNLAVGIQTLCTASDYVLTLADETSGQIVTTAEAAGIDPSGDAITETDTHVLNSGQTAGLELGKTAVLAIDADRDQVLTPGDTLAYTLVATNTGEIALSNVTVTDNKLGTALQAIGACMPQLGSTLNPGQQMVCTTAYTVQSAEANPIDNTANVTGKPVGRLAPMDASANLVLPFTLHAPPPFPLYAVGGRVWLDTTPDSVMQATETGIDGITLSLQRFNGTGWITATNSDGGTIPDQVTSRGGYYQFANFPQNAGQPYRVQVLPMNFKADITGTQPLYGAVSSYTDDGSAFPWAGGHDQGIGTSPDATNGIPSRGFDLGALPVGTTNFNAVDFGFGKTAALAAPPDLIITQSANPTAVDRNGTVNFTLKASNAVGAGNLTKVPAVLDTLPAGMTVASGWPTGQPPVNWSCTVSANRQAITCAFKGALPVAGGADIGGAITIPVNVGPTTARGSVTNAATITKLAGEPSFANNAAGATVTVNP